VGGGGEGMTWAPQLMAMLLLIIYPSLMVSSLSFLALTIRVVDASALLSMWIGSGSRRFADEKKVKFHRWIQEDVSRPQRRTSTVR